MNGAVRGEKCCVSECSQKLLYKHSNYTYLYLHNVYEFEKILQNFNKLHKIFWFVDSENVVWIETTETIKTLAKLTSTKSDHYKQLSI